MEWNGKDKITNLLHQMYAIWWLPFGERKQMVIIQYRNGISYDGFSNIGIFNVTC